MSPHDIPISDGMKGIWQTAIYAINFYVSEQEINRRTLSKR